MVDILLLINSFMHQIWCAVGGTDVCLYCGMQKYPVT